MAEPISDNKRIAKNTMYLYFRMLITMVVGLFTSRVVLNTLGVEDYGINNVVGGVVAMFSLISASISASISRFLTFELGRGDIEQLKKVFSTSVTIQFILAAIIIIVAEIVGIWFINNELVISPDRLVAARWVFHCSIISFAVGLISSPYNASIVSHERMNVFAYMSILDTILKLVIVYMLYISPYDKLKTFAVLGLAVTILMRILYGWYCKRNFEECTYHFTFDKKLFKSMFGFAGWNFIGSSAAVLRGQGNNILINIFSGGTIVNAAAGVATTLTGIISGFTGGFMTAFDPQITKLYAAQKYDELMTLIFRGAKFSAYLLLFLAIPIMINAEYILQLWLGIVPQHTIAFVNLTIIYMLSETISRPLITAKNATGIIRNYQIIVGGILLLTLPLSYLALKFGAPVESVYIANIITSISAFIARMYMLRGDIPIWSSKKFLTQIYGRILVTAIVSAIPPIIVAHNLDTPIYCIIASSVISFISSSITILYIGCNSNERIFIISKVKSTILKFLPTK